MFNTDQKIQAPTTNSNPYGLMATPAVDLAHTGRLPHLVDQARERAEQPETDGAREYTETAIENSLSFDRDKLIAALPNAVDEAMREAIPHRYSPEVANQIAETMTGILTGALCPVWPTVCTDTTPGHYDHHNHEHQVADKRGEELFHVGFVQFSDTTGEGAAVICIGSEDFDPSEVRAKTAELRRLLDQADAMADKVLALRA